MDLQLTMQAPKPLPCIPVSSLAASVSSKDLPFSLLRIPLEVRLEIYKLLPSMTYHALTLCNRQLYDEVQPLIYAHRTFILGFPLIKQIPHELLLYTDRSNLRRIIKFPKSTQAQIKHVLLHTNDDPGISGTPIGGMSLYNFPELLTPKFLTGVKELTMVHVVPDKEVYHQRQSGPILGWVNICVQAWTVPLTTIRTLDHEGPKEHEVKETERRIKLILVCQADLTGPLWTIAKLGELFSITANKNPIHDLEVWIPQDLDINLAGLTEKFGRGARLTRCDWRSFDDWNESYWITHMARKNTGFESVRIMTYDCEKDIESQRDTVVPLQVEGLQAYLDQRMLIGDPSS